MVGRAKTIRTAQGPSQPLAAKGTPGGRGGDGSGAPPPREWWSVTRVEGPRRGEDRDRRRGSAGVGRLGDPVLPFPARRQHSPSPPGRPTRRSARLPSTPGPSTRPARTRPVHAPRHGARHGPSRLQRPPPTWARGGPTGARSRLDWPLRVVPTETSLLCCGEL